MNLQFDLPKEQSSIIKVIGVGGGGSNAVNHMFEKGIRGVNYVVCNTDQQALDISPVYNKIQLGPEMTQGLGAGSRPEVGEQATIESEAEIKELLSKNTRMVFITAGMGGGTGTGGAPIVAKIAKEMGILTVGIVTTPFSFEGRRKLNQAEEGIMKLRDSVDSIIIISNDKIRDIYGNLSQMEAFAKADDILTTAAKGISEIITVAGMINVDFADVEYVMKDSGLAVMGTATAEGKDRAMRAVHDAINSPLLNDNNITGARNILINITSGNLDVTLDETTAINEYVQDAAGNNTDIIFGSCRDETLGDKLSVTIIATGFEIDRKEQATITKREVVTLFTEELKTEITDSLSTENEVNIVDESLNFLESNSFEVNDEDQNQSFTFELLNNEELSSSEESTFEFLESEEVDESLNFEEKKPVEEEKKDEYSFYVSKKEQPMQPTNQNNVNNFDLERKQKLKDVSYKWDNMAKVIDFEVVPAYLRRNVNLSDVPPSDSNNLSKFHLENSHNVNGENRPEIKKNNSFFHGNVD